jgi:hypothetical protein
VTSKWAVWDTRWERVCVHGFCGHKISNPSTVIYQCSSCDIFVITYPCGRQWCILILRRKSEFLVDWCVSLLGWLWWEICCSLTCLWLVQENSWLIMEDTFGLVLGTNGLNLVLNYELHLLSLTPWNTVLLEKLTSSQLAKKFLGFHGTRRFVTEFLSVRHVLPVLRQIDPAHAFTLHFLKVHVNSILPSMPGSSKWSLSPPKPCIHLSCLLYIPCPSHSSLFAHPNNIGWRVLITKLLIM